VRFTIDIATPGQTNTAEDFLIAAPFVVRTRVHNFAGFEAKSLARVMTQLQAEAFS
jgi:hypothetical protein